MPKLVSCHYVVVHISEFVIIVHFALCIFSIMCLFHYVHFALCIFSIMCLFHYVSFSLCVFFIMFILHYVSFPLCVSFIIHIMTLYIMKKTHNKKDT